MSRLSHRSLDRHLTEQDEEIQWRREQEELDAQNEEFVLIAQHEEALRENERIRREEEMNKYFDEMWRKEYMETEHIYHDDY